MTLPWGPYLNIDADACHGLVAGSRDSIGLVHVHQDDPSVERSNEKQFSPAHARFDLDYANCHRRENYKEDASDV